jgi:hypothetical protein
MITTMSVIDYSIAISDFPVGAKLCFFKYVLADQVCL